MLRILGHRKTTCSGYSRRDLLTALTAVPLAGMAPGVDGRSAVAAPAPDSNRSGPLGGFGSARRCILLYLWGSPSQIDTWDPKPDAPAEIRGSLGSIPTVIPGVRIGEVFPRTAAILDQLTVVRSLTHNYPVHGTAFATTGVPTTDIPMESNPRDGRLWPFIGSVIDYLAEQADPKAPPIPRNFGLPFPFGSKRGPARSGPFGGFLGPAYDTVWSEFRARGTREVLRDSGSPNAPRPIVADPYLGIRPGDRFEVETSAEGAVTLDRLNDRLSLLDQFDAVRRQADTSASPRAAPSADAFGRQRSLARGILASSRLRDALDVQREPTAVRDRYGMTLFGQSCLVARRILEAGGSFVTVCWDEYGLFNTGWDTHIHQTPRLKDELGPSFDAAFTALLSDLSARGMLADTAVVVLSEHGRTPRVQLVDGGGRDHWSHAYGALLAGAGFGRGRVVGRTDRHGGHVAETPFSPKDVPATIYHVMGIDPSAEIHDRLGRPYRIGGPGRVRTEVLA